jgi:putative endonuclease
MHYVYMLRSLEFPDQTYVGYTTDIQQRLACHNSGGSLHTTRYKPWEMITYFGFASQKKATDFEKYLKSQSGRAFAQKRFW